MAFNDKTAIRQAINKSRQKTGTPAVVCPLEKRAKMENVRHELGNAHKKWLTAYKLSVTFIEKRMLIVFQRNYQIII